MIRFIVFISVLFTINAARAATINFQQPNGTRIKILLDTTQRTHPALAVRIDNTVYYANMDLGCVPGDVCISYSGERYSIQDNSKYAFLITTTPTTSRFNFSISASGTFTIDWGDGSEPQKIVRTNTTNQTYSHTYKASDIYKIGLDGLATGYNMDKDTAAISFRYNTQLAKIYGSLGIIFPTLDNGDQPRFIFTFQDCANLSGKIPAKLFVGIRGQPISRMFTYLFRGCSKLVGEIPENLFADIKGTPTATMFESLFSGCSGLTGSIPENLFAGLNGAPQPSLFLSTFWGCSGLTGSVPENLFAGIKGAPAASVFRATFKGCSGLTGKIPAKLFAGINGAAAEYMFHHTFVNCIGLTGTIPYGLFGNLYGAPKAEMFTHTFENCSGLTGPTARTASGTRLYDIEYNGEKWIDAYPDAFTDMYTGSGIDTND